MSQEPKIPPAVSTEEHNPDHDKNKQSEEDTLLSKQQQTDTETAKLSWYDIMMDCILIATDPSQALDIPGLIKLRNALAEKFDEAALAYAQQNLIKAQKQATEMQANQTSDPSPINSLKQDEANAQVRLREAEVALRQAISKEDAARSQITTLTDFRQAQEWVATQQLTKTARTAVKDANHDLTNIQQKLNDLKTPQIPLTPVKSTVSRNVPEPSVEMTPIKKVTLTHGADSPSPQKPSLTAHLTRAPR